MTIYHFNVSRDWLWNMNNKLTVAWNLFLDAFAARRTMEDRTRELGKVQYELIIITAGLFLLNDLERLLQCLP